MSKKRLIKKQSIKKYVQKDYLIYLIALCVFVTSVLLGAVKASKLCEMDMASLSEITNGIFTKTFTLDYLILFKRSIFDNLKIIILSMICSFSIFTMGFCFVALAIKGFSIGFTSGFIILMYKIKGLWYILCCLVPYCIFSVAVMFFMCSVCINFAIKYRNKKSNSINFFAVMFIIFIILTMINICDGIFSSFIIGRL